MIKETNKIRFWKIRFSGIIKPDYIPMGTLENYLLSQPIGRLSNLQEIEIGEMK